MLIVLDTNVIISALLSSQGNPAEIIRRWEAGEFDIATSPPLLYELERPLNYERVQTYLKLSQEEINQFLNHFRATAITVEPQISLEIVKKDPYDNRVLECALAAGAAFILSGDEHLLELKEHEGVVILSPAGFITVLSLREDEGN